MVFRHPVKALVIASLAGAGLLAGCAREAPEETGTCTDCNVLLIVADTLRADRLGAYAYERPTSPFFDQISERGVLFEQTRATASCTFPSVNSLLTSREAIIFLNEETRPGIPDTVRSLPEMLAETGRRTLAVSASPVVRDTPSKHNPKGGFGRGFEVFDESVVWAHGTHVTLKAQELLEGIGDDPFFLYLHYMDPHDPYVPLKPFEGLFAGDYDGPHEFVPAGDPNPFSAMIREKTFKELADVERDIGHLSNLYDESIRTFDHALEQLFKVLESKGVLDETLILITADHGEAFYEHGVVKHCYTVFDNEVHVPLLALGPQVEKGRVQVAASLLDVVPTVLEYLGLEPEPELAGRSLLPFLGDPTLAGDGRLAFSGMGVYRSATDGRFKLIRHLAEDQYGLFDIQEEPSEKVDVLDDQRREFFRLRGALLEWIEANEGEKSAAEREDLAKEIEEELRSLGYLG
ncbi:MAG: sulfatase [Acidobacteriota bacterium]